MQFLFGLLVAWFTIWVMYKIFWPIMYPAPPKPKLTESTSNQPVMCEYCGAQVPGDQAVFAKKRYFCSAMHAERFFG